nr:uncharacterized protein LOC111506636 [Leptinotarsa decemlineata]
MTYGAVGRIPTGSGRFQSFKETKNRVFQGNKEPSPSRKRRTEPFKEQRTEPFEEKQNQENPMSHHLKKTTEGTPSEAPGGKLREQDESPMKQILSTEKSENLSNGEELYAAEKE